MAPAPENGSNEGGGGFEAVQRLKAIEAPQWLTPSTELSSTARSATQHLFSSLQPFCPKSPFERLLVEGFDAEQIWQQIDVQTKPLVSDIRRDLRRFLKNPEDIFKEFGGEKKVVGGMGDDDGLDDLGEFEGLDDEDEDEDEDGDEDEDEEEDEEDEEEEEEIEEEEGKEKGGIEDKFFKINELQEYLDKDEAREFGGGDKKKKDVDDEEEDEEEDDDEDEDGEIGGFDDGGENESEDELGTARYQDFFGGKQKKSSKTESKSRHASENFDTDDEQEDDEHFDNQKSENLSTYEKERLKQLSKVEEMEKSNLEPKTWTMAGEVTAAKRPVNSALEVDLDFEHNVRPAPVITEEVTASLEEIIKKRILEGQFDDVRKAPSLPAKAPRVVKEMDENKSKKGLAEIYEEDYAKTTGLAVPLSFSDEQKKEATMLFKKLCLKLDALSHFHFTPKPIIEDMAIQTNVPAIAMEEIAPVAVSDAAMLAPEEVFAGKGDVKEEAELTQEERKRRRANKKRKFKAETARRAEKRAKDNKSLIHSNGKEEA